jgi:hypothetical protein
MTTASIVYKRNELEEQLVSLFLRLNGYFTSGFIVHSSHKGDIREEVDILATRFPLNREPEREVDPCTELSVPTDRIDFVIGEVKNRDEAPSFNSSMFELDNIKYQLRWLGMFDEDETCILADQLLSQLNLKTDGHPVVSFPQLDPNNQVPARCQVRLILFDLNPNHPVDPRCISGQAVMDHIWKCLRADVKPVECARRYNYDAWGPVYSPMVRYFKDKRRKSAGSANELMAWLSNNYSAKTNK